MISSIEDGFIPSGTDLIKKQRHAIDIIKLPLLNSKLKSCCELSVNNIIALNVNLRESSFKGIESAFVFALMENAHSDAGY